MSLWCDCCVSLCCDYNMSNHCDGRCTGAVVSLVLEPLRRGKLEKRVSKSGCHWRVTFADESRDFCMSEFELVSAEDSKLELTEAPLSMSVAAYTNE